jgi:hypothetical protein
MLSIRASDRRNRVWLIFLVLFVVAISVAFLACGPARSAVRAKPTLSVVRYSSSALGFAVDYPRDWQVTEPTAQVDPSTRSWYVVEFVSNLYAYGGQAFGRYSVGVAVGESIGGTLTETVAYSLAPIVPQFRDQIERRCCLEVGGEPAMELVGFPLTRWGSRQVVVLHDDREYRLTFYPQIGLDGSTLSDVTARAAFEAFLRTFTFIPITAPPPVTPTITPVPTPMPTEEVVAHEPAMAEELEAAVDCYRRQVACLGKMHDADDGDSPRYWEGTTKVCAVHCPAGIGGTDRCRSRS